MTVRRGAARLAVIGVLLGGLLVVGAAPAMADDDSVRVRSASSFTAGGSAGSVAVEVRKRSDGCVLLRTGLRLRLDGVRADQVRVEVAAGGQWWPVPVSGGGVLATGRTSPADPTLCKGKSITVKYRLIFLAGAPGGKLTVAGEAVTATGRTIGRNSDTARVVGGRTPSPTPTPKRTPTPTPTPSPQATEAATADTGGAAGATLAAVGSGGGQAADAGDSGGGLSLVMVLGVGMVVVGLGLIALLFRRSRVDRTGRNSHGAGAPEIPLPRNPGGTTYRSGGGHRGSSNPGGAPSTGYAGQSGYAGYGGYPAAPGSGRVYGGQSGTVYPSPPPAGPGNPAGHGKPDKPGNPGTPPPPGSSAGGDSTVLMPRLPE